MFATSMFFLGDLPFVEQSVQALEVALQNSPVALQPFGGLRERLGLEPARPPLRVAPTRNQTGALQHLEMLGDRGLADRKRLGQLRDRRLTRGEPGQDRPPRG